MSVIWITGLSGSGKTTIGNALVKKMNTEMNKCIFLDGDLLREIFQNNEHKDYTSENRLLNARRISKISYLLNTQGHNVIVSTMSMFREIYSWNKENINQYYEIFVDIPISELVKRDGKKIYSKFKSGKLTNVVGMDIAYDSPFKPDYIIKPFSIEDLDNLIDNIVYKIKLKFRI